MTTRKLPSPTAKYLNLPPQGATIYDWSHDGSVETLIIFYQGVKGQES